MKMLELDIQRFADYGDVGNSNETTSAPKNIIKLKRGMAADVGHLTLEPGELAAVLDSNKLKMGDHLGTVRDVEAVSADSAKRTVGNLTIQQHGNTIDTFNGSENKTINLTPESGLATFEIRDGNLYVQGNNISDIDNYYINEYGHLMLVLNEVEKDLGKVVGEDGQGSDPNAIKGDGSIVKIVEMTLEEYQNLENIEEDTEYHIIDDTTLVTTQIVDDLNANESGMALSAKQGKVLNDKINNITNGTGLQLNGQYNTMKVFSDEHGSWLPTTLNNGEYQKVLSFIHPTESRAEFGIAERDGYAFPFTDGRFYQREYGYKVLDEGDLGNYNFYKFPVFTIDGTTPSREATLSIASKGRPVFVSINGDLNSTSSGGSWVRITLKRNGTILATQIAQGTGDSQNIPFSIQYLDIVAAGSHAYQVVFERGGNNSQFGEEDSYQTPNFLVFEI